MGTSGGVSQQPVSLSLFRRRSAPNHLALYRNHVHPLPHEGFPCLVVAAWPSRAHVNQDALLMKETSFVLYWFDTNFNRLPDACYLDLLQKHMQETALRCRRFLTACSSCCETQPHNFQPSSDLLSAGSVPLRLIPFLTKYFLANAISYPLIVVAVTRAHHV